MLSKNAQRPTMCRQFFHIEDPQSVRRKDLFCGEKGKVRKVLVIDGVKLIFFHQTLKVRKLHGNYTVGLQENLQAGDKVVQIRNLREHIVSEEQVGSLSG